MLPSGNRPSARNRLRVGAIGMAVSIALLIVTLLALALLSLRPLERWNDSGTDIRVIAVVPLLTGFAGVLVFALVLFAGWLDWLIERDDENRP